MSTCNGDYQELARKELINKLVLTRYDNRTQRIDNIDFTLTPSTFTLDNESLIDYYLNKFDITIKDPDQPLIVYCPRRPGESIVRRYFKIFCFI
jgi:aubergine-like protein